MDVSLLLGFGCFFGKIGVRHVFVGRLEELMYYDEIREVWLARFRLFHYWKVVSYIYIHTYVQRIPFLFLNIF